MNSFKNKVLKEAPVVGTQNGRAVYSTYSDQKLLAHTPDLAIRFLENEGRNIRLKDWQFIQTVDAIQKLF